MGPRSAPDREIESPGHPEATAKTEGPPLRGSPYEDPPTDPTPPGRLWGENRGGFAPNYDGEDNEDESESELSLGRFMI